MGNGIPQLTLEPQLEAKAEEAAPKAAAEVKMEETVLSAEEKQAVAEFAKQIDVTNANQVLMYGAGAQKNIADFSETALNNVRTKDLGEVGEALSSLVVELKNIDFGNSDEKKGFFSGLFKKGKNQIDELKAQYSQAETNVDKISQMLEQHQVVFTERCGDAGRNV